MNEKEKSASIISSGINGAGVMLYMEQNDRGAFKVAGCCDVLTSQIIGKLESAEIFPNGILIKQAKSTR